MLGEDARAVSPIIGLATIFIAAPLLAWATGGRYYLARPVDILAPQEHRCILCENSFEPSDMAHCPVYQGNICSLCRSEEHTSELQSLMRISYAVFCLKKK